jgi:ATP-dependent DNA ligase
MTPKPPKKQRGGSRAVFLYGFDLLHLDGEDLRRHPWEIRRATLTGLLRRAHSGVRLSEHLDGDGESSSSTPAPSAPRASWPSGGTSPTGRVGAPIGSR